jgi:hypothetical protein
MSITQTDYPTEYRGNTIHDEKRVSELQPDKKPDLQLVTGSHEIDQILEHIGVEHDRESIVLEDSYSCLWVDTDNGDYSEVWGIHKSVPYTHLWAVRLR